MSFKINEIIFCLLAGALLTMVTFFVIRQVDRQQVQKEFAPYLEATVEGRGWPVAYIADDPSKRNFGAIAGEDKFFPGVILLDWLVLSVLTAIVFYGYRAFMEKSG